MINALLDMYDDPSGIVLKEKVASLEDVPEFIKQAERLDRETLDKLPDDVFALVMLDSGDKMRKYACTDKGNTALSVLYFMETKNNLPAEAQKTAAKNLMEACRWYSMEPPAELEKTALLGPAMGAVTLGMGAMEGNRRYKQRKAALQQGATGSQIMKMSEMGANIMPKTKVPEKTASLKPHVDITGKHPPQQVTQETGRFYALTKEGGARYPIDTMGQVQKAITYFEKYAERFTPPDRHLFCANVSRRADELGVPVTEKIAKYGASTMAQDAPVAIYQRQRMFREGTSEHGLLQEMREKCASIKPEFLAVTLENFDKQAGLDRLWDNGLPDPYYSIFGVEKRAEYSFTTANDTINETRLKRCAKECKKQVQDLFNEDVAEEFSKDPVQIFDSLPLDQKRIIMRLASQVEE